MLPITSGTVYRNLNRRRGNIAAGCANVNGMEKGSQAWVRAASPFAPECGRIRRIFRLLATIHFLFRPALAGRGCVVPAELGPELRGCGRYLGPKASEVLISQMSRPPMIALLLAPNWAPLGSFFSKRA